MPFIIFHKRSCERSQLPLTGWFLSRCCFTLCITVEVEPRIVKQYKCQYCCICKNYRGKVMEDGKKCLCIIFWLTLEATDCAVKADIPQRTAEDFWSISSNSFKSRQNASQTATSHSSWCCLADRSGVYGICAVDSSGQCGQCSICCSSKGRHRSGNVCCRSSYSNVALLSTQMWLYCLLKCSFIACSNVVLLPTHMCVYCLLKCGFTT